MPRAARFDPEAPIRVSGNELGESVAAGLGVEVRALTPVAGGSINEAWRAELEGGGAAFVKSRSDAPEDEFATEAAGLAWLGGAQAVRIPSVLARGGNPAWIALDWIEHGALSPAGEVELGPALAALHRSGAARHGELPPGSPDSVLRVGSVGIELEPADEWPSLYAQQLLLPLVRRAGDAGRLSAAYAESVERVCARIDAVAGPPEPAARLHGDLWSGNVLADASGDAWLIDPAAYGGHREVDLAMLRLFGSPGERLFNAYDEAHPLADGHAERVELWQIFPLLVHAVLFGGGYGGAAGAAARRFL
jgi:fructosamine-3-kinase